MSDTSKPAQWAMDIATEMYDIYEPGAPLEIVPRYAHALERAYQRGRDEGLEDASKECDAHFENEKKWQEHYGDKEPDPLLRANCVGGMTASYDLANTVRALKSEPKNNKGE